MLLKKNLEIFLFYEGKPFIVSKYINKVDSSTLKFYSIYFEFLLNLLNIKNFEGGFYETG